MDNQDWKVSISGLQDTFTASVYIYRKTATHIQVLRFTEHGPKIESTERKEEEYPDIAPSFKANYDDVMGMVRGFIAFGREQGFKVADDSFNKGKLEATERHLEDMRLLALKKKA